jgi:hypothetical protein
MSSQLMVFSIKRNLVFMNNLYRKVAAASVGIALGFTLGANKEAKAATFTLTDPEIFFGYGSARGPAANIVGSGNDLTPGSQSVKKFYTDFERRAFYEFDIGNLSLASNTVIRRAILKTPLRNVSFNQNGYLFLHLFGYVGNGRADLSDFNAGVSIGRNEVVGPNSYPTIPLNSIDFDVTSFVNERVNSYDDFAGFGFRFEGLYHNHGSATLRDNYNAPPSLIIETADVTEPVPEPTTILSTAIALGWGGWLKRKNSIKQNKTKSRESLI